MFKVTIAVLAVVLFALAGAPSNDGVSSYDIEMQRKAEKQEFYRKARARAKEIMAEIKAREARFERLIKERKIAIGMSKDQVIKSWGKPDDINRSVGSWGVREQWVYCCGQYLYFKNQKLNSWQG